MKTFIPTVAQSREKKWFLVNASGQVLGRLASRVATILQGKHKPTFVPHLDMGDFVVVVNADKIRVTGNKLTEKIYYRHSGYMGGLKARTFREQSRRDCTKLVKLAVRNMLPKNILGRNRLSKLKVYAGEHHPHEAQQPQDLALGGKW